MNAIFKAVLLALIDKWYLQPMSWLFAYLVNVR